MQICLPLSLSFSFCRCVKKAYGIKLHFSVVWVLHWLCFCQVHMSLILPLNKFRSCLSIYFIDLLNFKVLIEVDVNINIFIPYWKTKKIVYFYFVSFICLVSANSILSAVSGTTYGMNLASYVLDSINIFYYQQI